MDADYIIGEVSVRLKKKEIERLETGAKLKGRIWVHSEGRVPHQEPIMLRTRRTLSWASRTKGRGRTRSFEIEFPRQGLSLIKQGSSLATDFVTKGVIFRKIRVMNEGIR